MTSNADIARSMADNMTHSTVPLFTGRSLKIWKNAVSVLPVLEIPSTL